MPREQRPGTITLDEVNKAWPNGMPPIDHDTREPEVGIHEFYRNMLAQEIGKQLLATFRSIREDAYKPQTVLHTLMLNDGLTRGQIAAKMHVDPRSLTSDLDIATEAGWVEADGAEPLRRYSLLPTPGSSDMVVPALQS